MRDVADRAEVALGTLYRYFPSKVHLLVALMHHEVRSLSERLERRPVAGDTAADRVVAVLTRGIQGLQRDPDLSEAMTRALMFADASAAADVHAVTELTTQAVITAMHGPDREPTPGRPRDRSRARAGVAVLDAGVAVGALVDVPAHRGHRRRGPPAPALAHPRHAGWVGVSCSASRRWAQP